MNQGRTATGVVTGKPISLGGSLGRSDATGRGVFVTAREAALRLGIPIKNARVAIQGFGNVGEATARIFHQEGARIVALQDETGAVYNENGFDPVEVKRHRKEAGGLSGLPGAEIISTKEFWETECEFLVPAAVEEQITVANASRIRAKVVVEGANGPTTTDADLILQDRNILVVPDVIANAGGVTVSYFEWVQDFSSFFWTEAEINQRLEMIMSNAFGSIWDVAQAKGISLRTAAFVVACTRVLEARAQRGLYP